MYGRKWLVINAGSRSFPVTAFVNRSSAKVQSTTVVRDMVEIIVIVGGIEMANGTYSIVESQYPIVGGIAGHNLLVMKDPNGNVVGELDGLATTARATPP